MEIFVKEQYSGALLAYLGDAVIELWVRELLLSLGLTQTSVCSKEALFFVTAKAQSEAYEKIKDILTEEENDVFRRGRNAHVSVPKSASHADYHRSTGMEALAAALYSEGKRDRIDELFFIAYKDKIDDMKKRHEI